MELLFFNSEIKAFNSESLKNRTLDLGVNAWYVLKVLYKIPFCVRAEKGCLWKITYNPLLIK
ncbi:hypothetical protein D3C78_934130 [compost metagenome]